MKPRLHQRILSFFYPVKIDTAPGKTTPVLGLYRFQGRWQLSSATALYSDGAAYRPLTMAFDYLKKELPGKKNMLVLGAGLGSAISVLHKMNSNIPAVTLVDIDPQVIEWGREIIQSETGISAEWICADVRTFVEQHHQQYDLIVLDVFQDRTVPAFVTSSFFLDHCKQLMSKQNSTLVFNYIVNNEKSWKELLENIQGIFKLQYTIATGINRIMILKNNA